MIYHYCKFKVIYSCIKLKFNLDYNILWFIYIIIVDNLSKKKKANIKVFRTLTIIPIILRLLCYGIN